MIGWHMKFYYLDVSGVDANGYACAVYLRFDRDTYTDDIDYARRFETRVAAEKYRDVNGLTGMVGCASDSFQFGSKNDEAYQFVRRMGKGCGKYFEFDGFTLIKDVKQLRNALYWVGLYTKKKFSVKMVASNTAYVARVK